MPVSSIKRSRLWQRALTLRQYQARFLLLRSLAVNPFFCARDPMRANCDGSSAKRLSPRLWLKDAPATLPKKYQIVLSLPGAASGVPSLRAKVDDRRRVRAGRPSLALDTV